MDDGPSPVPPVPGLPTAALADGELVAKRWIERLIAVSSLETLAEVPVATLAAEAPGLCAGIVRSLGSDDELALLPLLTSNPATMAGAVDVRAAVTALGQLRDATIEAVLAAVEGADAAWTARVALRAGQATDRLLEAVFAERAAAPGPAPPAAPARPEPAEPSAPDEAPPDPLDALHRGGDAVRDGAPPWERMVARAVARHLEDGQPFAVLAVEAEGAERLAAAEGGGEALERADRALGDTVRARDRVVSDPPARWWALVPEAGGEAARALARRIGAAVEAVEHAGAPLRVSIGVACCPRDGVDAEMLLAASDERLLEARAAGRLLDDG